MDLLTSLITAVILLISPVEEISPEDKVSQENTMQVCIALPETNEEDNECIDPYAPY